MFEELDLWIGEIFGLVKHNVLTDDGCTGPKTQACPTGKACNVQTQAVCKGEPTQKCAPSVSCIVVNCVTAN